MASAKELLEQLRKKEPTAVEVSSKLPELPSIDAKSVLAQLRTQQTEPRPEEVVAEEPIMEIAEKEPGFLERLQSIRELPAIQAIETAASPVRQAKLAERALRGGLEQAGEAIAESPLAQISPELAAGLGTGVSMAPDIALAVPGGLGANLARQAAIRFSSKNIGAQMGAVEKAAGISSKLPSKKGLAKVLGIQGKADFAEIANRMEDMVDAGFGTNLSAETLKAFIKKSKSILKRPEFSDRGGRVTPEGTDLLRIKNKVEEALNVQVPGRAALQQQFAQAKQRERILGTVLRGTSKAAKTVGKGAAILGLGAAGFRGGQALFGG